MRWCELSHQEEHHTLSVTQAGKGYNKWSIFHHGRLFGGFVMRDGFKHWYWHTTPLPWKMQLTSTMPMLLDPCHLSMSRKGEILIYHKTFQTEYPFATSNQCVCIFLSMHKFKNTKWSIIPTTICLCCQCSPPFTLLEICIHKCLWWCQ